MTGEPEQRAEPREEWPGPLRHSLCARCALAKRIVSAKGSVFLLCRASERDPRHAKYPPQPVLVCASHTS